MSGVFRSPARLPREIPEHLLTRTIEQAEGLEGFDGLPMTTRELAQANVTHYLAGQHLSQANKATFWAWESSEELRRMAPDLCWESALYSLDAASTLHVVSCVAAGPIENLIHDNGEQLIEEVEILARQSDRFCLALSMVWSQGFEERPYWV